MTSMKSEARCGRCDGTGEISNCGTHAAGCGMCGERTCESCDKGKALRNENVWRASRMLDRDLCEKGKPSGTALRLIVCFSRSMKPSDDDLNALRRYEASLETEKERTANVR